MTASHLRGPVKGLSSYDKICSHLRVTPDFQDYIARVSQALDQVHVSGWDFSPGGDEYATDPAKKKNVAPPSWSLTIDWGTVDPGQEPLTQRAANNANVLSEWNLDLSTICDERTLDEIVHRHFNTKTCPTYFCKKEKLLGRDKDGDRTHSLDNKWALYARGEIREALADKISRTQDRLRKEMQDAIDSAEFNKDMTEFHERGIIEEIKIVLHKFHTVAKPHILKAALDEYVMHEIMES
jgi:hypothetical protein